MCSTFLQPKRGNRHGCMYFWRILSSPANRRSHLNVSSACISNPSLADDSRQLNLCCSKDVRRGKFIQHHGCAIFYVSWNDFCQRWHFQTSYKACRLSRRLAARRTCCRHICGIGVLRSNFRVFSCNSCCYWLYHGSSYARSWLSSKLFFGHYCFCRLSWNRNPAEHSYGNVRCLIQHQYR